MTDSTCLHIQDHMDGPIRVVEVPWISVRIGRAGFCEVRLTGPGVPDEICRLHRRGQGWQLVPMVPPGTLSIGDEPVSGACELPFDVPVRFGPFCLILRQNRSVEPDWENYRPPAPAPRERKPIEPASFAAATPDYHRSGLPLPIGPPPVGPSPKHASTGTGPNPWEARWKAAGARLREAASKDRPEAPTPKVQPRNRYQGVPLKDPLSARPGPTASAAPAIPEVPTSFRTSPSSAVSSGLPTVSTFTRHDNDASSPPAALGPPRALRPASAFLGWSAGEDHEPRPIRPTVYANPALDFRTLVWAVEPLEPSRTFVGPPQPREVEFTPGPPSIIAIEDDSPNLDEPQVPARSIDLETVDMDAVVAELSARPAPIHEPEADADIHEIADHAPDAIDSRLEPSDCEPASARSVAKAIIPEAGAIAEPGPHCEALAEPTWEARSDVFCTPIWSTGWPVDQAIGAPTLRLEEAPRFVADTAELDTQVLPDEEPAPDLGRTFEAREGCGARSPRPQPDGRRGGSETRSASLLGIEDQASRSPRNPGGFGERSQSVPRGGMVAGEPGKSVEFLDLPSAREILAGTGPPPELRPATPATPPSRPDHVVLLPTYAEEPGHWSPPLWFAWPPAALMVLLLGAAGAWLSWCWARESYNASVVARRLLSAAPTPSKVRPLPEYVVPPAASWWQTTPLHLAQWGVYLGRVGGEEGDRTDEARELIDGAVRISPLHPMARLARAQLEPEGAQPRAEVAELGMSRDAISLAWSARQQRLAGKKEIALRLYRQALRLADEGEDPRAASPAFSEEPGARRYLLPGEAVVGPIVNDLASDPRWTFEEWSAALPSGSVAELAAARILNAQGRPEAERLVKQIVERAGAAPASAHERALRLAVEAEALALRSRWAKSAQCYREAIDLIEDSKVQRSWWFNLADIAVHLDDEAQRQAALEAAGEASPADDISRRAADLQRLPETRNRLRPGGTKAN